MLAVKYVVELTEKAFSELKYTVELLVNPSSPSRETRICPHCRSSAVYLGSLHRYYCFNCKRYVD